MYPLVPSVSLCEQYPLLKTTKHYASNPIQHPCALEGDRWVHGFPYFHRQGQGSLTLTKVGGSPGGRIQWLGDGDSKPCLPLPFLRVGDYAPKVLRLPSGMHNDAPATPTGLTMDGIHASPHPQGPLFCRCAMGSCLGLEMPRTKGKCT